MKSAMKYLNSAFRCSLVLGVLCYVVYPTTLTLVGQALFPKQANGSLITAIVGSQKQVVSSEYVGQRFESSRFSHGRISSVNYNCYTEGGKAEGSYGGVSFGSYNYGNSDPDLKAQVEADLAAWMKDHPDMEQGDIPSELLTTSGSGLDPHITVQEARAQIGAVTEISGLTEDELNSIIDRNTTGRTLGIFGEETVNVLDRNPDIVGASGMISREQG